MVQSEEKGTQLVQAKYRNTEEYGKVIIKEGFWIEFCLHSDVSRGS